MGRWSTLLVLAVLLPSKAVAQSPARQGFSFGLSLGIDQAREDLLVPMRWAGPMFGIRLGWDHRTGRFQHDASLALPVSLYQNRFDHKGLGLGLELTYGVVRQLGGVPGREATGEVASLATRDGDARLGVGAHIRYDLHDGWYASWDEEHGYWFTALGLGPRFAWTAPTGAGWRLGATLDVPVLALVSRPRRARLTKVDPLTSLSYHLIDTGRSMRLKLPPGYAAVQAGIRLARERASGLALGFELELATCDAPERVITLTNRIHVSRRVAW